MMEREGERIRWLLFLQTGCLVAWMLIKCQSMACFLDATLAPSVIPRHVVVQHCATKGQRRRRSDSSSSPWNLSIGDSSHSAPLRSFFRISHGVAPPNYAMLFFFADDKRDCFELIQWPKTTETEGKKGGGGRNFLLLSPPLRPRNTATQ